MFRGVECHRITDCRKMLNVLWEVMYGKKKTAERKEIRNRLTQMSQVTEFRKYIGNTSRLYQKAGISRWIQVPKYLNGYFMVMNSDETPDMSSSTGEC